MLFGLPSTMCAGSARTAISAAPCATVSVFTSWSQHAPARDLRALLPRPRDGDGRGHDAGRRLGEAEEHEHRSGARWRGRSRRCGSVGEGHQGEQRTLVRPAVAPAPRPTAASIASSGTSRSGSRRSSSTASSSTTSSTDSRSEHARRRGGPRPWRSPEQQPPALARAHMVPLVLPDVPLGLWLGPAEPTPMEVDAEARPRAAPQEPEAQGRTFRIQYAQVVDREHFHLHRVERIFTNERIHIRGASMYIATLLPTSEIQKMILRAVEHPLRAYHRARNFFARPPRGEKSRARHVETHSMATPRTQSARSRNGDSTARIARRVAATLAPAAQKRNRLSFRSGSVPFGPSHPTRLSLPLPCVSPERLPSCRHRRRRRARRDPGTADPRRPRQRVVLTAQAQRHSCLRGPGPCQPRRQHRFLRKASLRCHRVMAH